MFELEIFFLKKVGLLALLATFFLALNKKWEK